MFKNALKNEMNKARTDNGAAAFHSTKSKVLDLFGLGGSAFDMERHQLEDMINQALNENEEFAIRTILYLSDVREGQGVRDIFRAAAPILARRYPEETKIIMLQVPEFTRWDMLYEFEGTQLEDFAFRFLEKTARDAMKNGESHLVFKWLKSPKTASAESTRLGRKTARYFGMTEKEYRKFLKKGRAELDLVENKMRRQDWDKINYENVPSKANLKYKQAFERNDPYRYEAYLDRVLGGEAKMNMSVAYPHEVISQYTGSGWGVNITSYNKTLEAAWQNLANYSGDKDILVVADTSGSMTVNMSEKSNATPMDASIGLAIYTAEHNTGMFANTFMSFSEKPELIEINDKDSLMDKIKRVRNTHWGMNTDIDKVFRKILKAANGSNATNEDLPSTIVIISDMQFDECTNIDNTNYQEWREAFEARGYTLPDIVFWQVATESTVPVTASEKGAAIVSGMSPSVLKFIYEGKIVSPYDFMLEVILSPRYNIVEEAFEYLPF